MSTVPELRQNIRASLLDWDELVKATAVLEKQVALAKEMNAQQRRRRGSDTQRRDSEDLLRNEKGISAEKRKQAQKAGELQRLSRDIRQQHEKLTRESEKTARLAQESLEYERRDLRLAEKKLRRLKQGTDEYTKQHRLIRRIQGRIQSAENKVITAQRRRAGQTSGRIGSQDWVSGNIFLDTLYGRLGAGGQFARSQFSAGASAGGGLTAARSFALGGGVLVGAGVAAALAKATKAFAPYEQAISKTTALTHLSREASEELGDAALDMSRKYGVAVGEIQQAGFTLASAGFEGERLRTTLDATTKAAAAGLGEVGVVANAVAKSLENWKDEQLSAETALNSFIEVGKVGLVDARDLGEVYADIGTDMAGLNVSFAETGGLLAKLSLGSKNASVAGTQLSAVTRRLLQRSSEYGRSIEELRAEIGQDGLLRTLIKLRKELGLTQAEFAATFVRAEAIKGVNGLLADEGGTLDIVEQLRDSTGELDMAWTEMMSDIMTIWRQFKAEFGSDLVDLGEAAAPLAKSILQIGIGVLNIRSHAAALSNLPGLSGLNLLRRKEDEPQGPTGRVREEVIRHIETLRRETDKEVKTNRFATAAIEDRTESTEQLKKEVAELTAEERLAIQTAAAVERAHRRSEARASITDLIARGAPREDVEQKLFESPMLQEETVEQSEKVIVNYRELSGLAQDVVRDFDRMANALGNVSDQTRQFMANLIGALDATGELVVEVQKLNALRAAGNTSALAALGPIGAAIGVAASLVSFFGAGRRRRRQSGSTGNTSAAISREVTEVQGSELVSINRQQLWYLRRIAESLQGGYIPATRSSSAMPSSIAANKRLPGSTNVQIQFGDLPISVPVNPDNPNFQQAIGQAVSAAVDKYGLNGRF